MQCGMESGGGWVNQVVDLVKDFCISNQKLTLTVVTFPLVKGTSRSRSNKCEHKLGQILSHQSKC